MYTELPREGDLEGGVVTICDVDWTVDGGHDLDGCILGIDDVHGIVFAVSMVCLVCTGMLYNLWMCFVVMF